MSLYYTLGALIALLQRPEIEKKMEEAPDSAYEIGVVIGSYLPFILLAGLAYAIYRYNRNKGDS